MFLIIGANSEIGAATARRLAASGEPILKTTRRRAEAGDEMILLDLDQQIEQFSPPTGVTSACIFVAVARLAACADDPAGSAMINCERTIALVDRLTSRGIYTLFLSTNQVFDGETAWVAADTPTSPVSEYGRQKALTEATLRERMAGGAPAGVLRFAKIVSPKMPLIENWKHELAAGHPVSAFADMMMAPTPVDSAAAAIVCMMKERVPVITQLSGPRDITYADVARLVARHVGAGPEMVRSVSALDHGMPAGSTPRNSTLDSSYLAERYGIVVPGAEQVLSNLI